MDEVMYLKKMTNEWEEGMIFDEGFIRVTTMQLNVGALTERAIHYCKRSWLFVPCEKLPWLTPAVLLRTCSSK